jgi:hypothetical protein
MSWDRFFVKTCRAEDRSLQKNLSHFEDPIVNFRPALRLFCLVVGALCCAGCGKDEDLRVYDAASTPKPVVFNTPDTWRRGAARREFGEVYAWIAVDGDDQKLQITISRFDPKQFDMLENVNRWRRQVGLSAVTEAELKTEVKPQQVDQYKLQSIELIGPEKPDGAAAKVGLPRTREATWLAIFTAKGRLWILKLRGPLDFAQREKATFDDWVPRAVRAIDYAVVEPSNEEQEYGD